MISFCKIKDPYHSVRKEFLCDGPDDIANLPTNCEPGSIALILETSEAYMLNNAKEWVSVTFGGASPSGEPVIYDGGVI